MIRVVIESPFAGDVERNTLYVRACMRDCLLRDESPYASHALYTQPGVLRDDVPEERKLGIEAGFEWRDFAHYTVFYEDLGWSRGMVAGREDCVRKGAFYMVRKLGDDWEAKAKEEESK